MPKKASSPSPTDKLMIVVQLLVAVGLTAQLPNMTAPVLVAALTLAAVILPSSTRPKNDRRR